MGSTVYADEADTINMATVLYRSPICRNNHPS